MLSKFFSKFLCALVVAQPLAAFAATAPFEGIRASDFARGERSSPGELAVGLYSHYQRFDQTYPDGESFDGASEVHHVRWVPVLTLDYQPQDKRFRGAMFLHGGLVKTDLREANTLKNSTGAIGGLADIILLGLWSPWMKDVSEGHQHSFFDLHNLTVGFGPKINLGREDNDAGSAPGAVFRRTSSGTHDLNFGLIYSAPVSTTSWLYYYSQWTLPVSHNNFGFKPGSAFSNKIGYSWFPNQTVQLFLEAETIYQNRGSDGRIAIAPANSGGTLVFARPGVTYDLASNWGMELSVAIPVARNLNGLQPKQTIDLFFGFYKSIDMGI